MVVALHVIDQRGMEALEQYAGANTLELERSIIDDAKKELKTIEDDLKRSGFKVKTKIKTGVPLREILRTEEEEDHH